MVRPPPTPLRHQFDPSPERSAGFTLVEISILVAIIGILLSISLPNFLKSREKAQQDICVANLKLVDHAVQQWAFESGKAVTDTYELTDPELLKYFKGSSLPVCSAGGTYRPGSTFAEGVKCSLYGQGHSR